MHLARPAAKAEAFHPRALIIGVTKQPPRGSAGGRLRVS